MPVIDLGTSRLPVIDLGTSRLPVIDLGTSRLPVIDLHAEFRPFAFLSSQIWISFKIVGGPYRATRDVLEPEFLKFHPKDYSIMSYQNPTGKNT